MKKFILFFTTISVFCGFILNTNAQIVITEVLPNPDGTDATGEFIEIYNSSDTGVDLTQFQIDNNEIQASGDIIIQPNELVLITKPGFEFSDQIALKHFTSSFTLSNGGDRVEVSNGNEIIDFFNYSSSSSGKSIVRPIFECNTGSSIFESKINLGSNWTSIGSLDSPFNYSIFTPDLIINNKLVAESAKFADGSSLNFEMNPIECLQTLDNFKFEYNNDSISSFPFSNTLNSESIFKSSYFDFSKSYSIQVKDTDDGQKEDNDKNKNQSLDVRINEIYPNPESGEEWIELFNFGNDKIEFDNWYLTDESDKKTKLDDLSIEAKGYLVIESPNLKTTLNNSGDTIYLFSPEDDQISKVTYPELEKGTSYIYSDNKYSITSSVTKNAANQIVDDWDDPEEQTEENKQEEEEENEPDETAEIKDKNEEQQKSTNDPVYNYQYSTPQTTTIEIVPFNYPEKIFSKVVYTETENKSDQIQNNEQAEDESILNSPAFNLSLASSSIYGLYGFEESRRYLERLMELFKNALKG